MNTKIRKQIERRKQRIAWRLDRDKILGCDRPAMTASNSVRERLAVIKAARDARLQTSVMFGPLLPFLSDSQAAIDAPLEQAADLGVDRIWIDAINPRPRVWPAVADLLRANFPELPLPYRKILFDGTSRTQYLEELRARVDDAARRKSQTDRVAACM